MVTTYAHYKFNVLAVVTTFMAVAQVLMADTKEGDQLERLNSRVDQQSTLISMLKKRVDKTQEELSECQQKYESSQKQVGKLQELLAEVTGEKTQLEGRFHTLADNHEQMIRIKDEYKEANYRLRHQQRDETSMVEQLHEELKKMKSDRDSLEAKCELLVSRVSELKSKMDDDRTAHQVKVEDMSSSHSNEVAVLQRNLERMQLTVKKVTEESEDKSKQMTELQKNLMQLKHSLSTNETNRQEHLTTVQTLETKLSQVKQELEQTRKSHRDELSRDSCINKLRKALDEAQQNLSVLREEYSAYKTHSNLLLSHERELNNKLRHLLD